MWVYSPWSWIFHFRHHPFIFILSFIENTLTQLSKLVFSFLSFILFFKVKFCFWVGTKIFLFFINILIISLLISLASWRQFVWFHVDFRVGNKNIIDSHYFGVRFILKKWNLTRVAWQSSVIRKIGFSVGLPLFCQFMPTSAIFNTYAEHLF